MKRSYKLCPAAVFAVQAVVLLFPGGSGYLVFFAKLGDESRHSVPISDDLVDDVEPSDYLFQ